MQAALLSVKLPHLDAYNEHRRRIAARYDAGLAGIKHIATPKPAAWALPVWHQYVIRTPHRDALRDHLAKAGIDTLIHYPVPNHLQAAYAEQRKYSPQLAEYERTTAEILSLPISPTLTDPEVDRVCAAIKSFAV